ncbi:hypothetical protein Leryth_001426 [Lithospermum erythrorhizon]|nr:hypothetical protein Leryth_001426 [Lithospermum erythrorhizon]
MHFSHPHDLHIIDIQLANENPPKNCFGCNIPLFGSCYTCSTCNFYLHQYCFDLPHAIQSQSHPQHPLSLLHSPYSIVGCNNCGESCTNIFVYTCSLCNFNVHANCARLDEKKYKDDNDRYIGELLGQKLEENKLLRAKIDELQNGCHISQEEHQMSIDQTPNEADLLRMEQDEYYHNKFLQSHMKSNTLPTEVMDYYASDPKIELNDFAQYF